MAKALAASGNKDFNIFWLDEQKSELDVAIHLSKRPEGNGLWVWEAGVWRRPTNREWGALFKNENPFEVGPERKPHERI